MPVERVDAFWASKARWETRPVRFHGAGAIHRLSRFTLPAFGVRITHGGAFEREPMGAMNQRVADGVGDTGLADRGMLAAGGPWGPIAGLMLPPDLANASYRPAPRPPSMREDAPPASR